MIGSLHGNDLSEIIITESLNCHLLGKTLILLFCLFVSGPGGTPRPIELHSHDPVR